MLRKKVSRLEKRRCLCVDGFSENVYVCVLNRNCWQWGLPGGSDGKESACNAGDLNSIPGSGRSHGGGHGNPLQYSCLGNLVDRGAWWATVRGLAKSWTWLSVQTHTLTTAVKKVREKAIPTILTHDNRVLRSQSAETYISSVHFSHLAVGADMPTVRILLWTWDFYQHGNSGSMQITVHTEWRFSSFLQQHELNDQHIQEWDRTSRLIGKKRRETGDLWCLVHLPNRKKSKRVQRMGRAGELGHLRIVWQKHEKGFIRESQRGAKKEPFLLGHSG